MNFKYLKNKSIFILFLVLPFLILNAEPDTKEKNTNKLRKVSGEPSYKRFNINNISTFIKNDGESDINPNGNSGLTFPKGSNKQAVFQSGFLWGGKVNGQIRVGGSVYRQGTVPGKVLNSGVPATQLTAESPTAANVRNYRVRPDYKTGDLSSEVADGEGAEADVRAAYEKDWNEWPAADGAPYDDIDNNGVYDPAVDVPGVPGADQTIWFVCNDTDPAQTDFMYGSAPMGIEEQVTVWGYNTTGALGNMFFRKYKIINKSNTPFEDMYVSMWNDPDNGSATDDFVGCDTTLSMTFCYNGKANDATYGNTPPATGFDFFQGPIVDAPGDSAVFDGKRIYDKRNLPMSAHYFFINSDPVYSDPDQGEYATGTLQWYNLFQGRIGTTGELFVDPNTGQSTTFALAGNPQTNSGWVDGQLHPPGDRRAGMVAGPFTMAAGDTQEIVVAEIAAGAFPPVDRIGAIGLLKFYDLQAQLAYDNFFDIPKAAPTPNVNVTELNQEIVLNWGNNFAAVNATESYNNKGFVFQGYNVYQLPSPSAGFGEARRIATYDKIDGIGKIEGLQFDTQTGVVGTRVLQFGSDNGVQRFISLKNDAFNGGLPLVNGTRYYFAVTSYSYNPDPDAVPNVLENPLSTFTIVPRSTNPGERLDANTGENQTAVHASGSANSTVDFTVVDPTKLTGHNYEVFFNEQHYYLDQSGKWLKTNFPDSIGKHLSKDVSPSSVSGTGVYAKQPGTVDLKMTIDLQTPDGDFIDGVKLIFPAGVVINSAVDQTHCANGNTELAVINGQEIMWGNNDTTGFGCFDGSQLIEVNVNSFALPLTVDYVLYDDGYGIVYEVDSTYGVVNATGSFQITAIGNSFVTQNHWNVRDVTSGQVVIEDQTVLSGADIYADVEGPGGSTGNLGATAPSTSNPVFDGIQVSVVGSYDPPLNILSQTLNGANLRIGNGGRTPYDLTNYTIFGNTTGWSQEAQGWGTTSIDELQQDYEYRWTGVLDSTTINGKKVYITKEGTGSMATFYGARLYDWAQHPLNPTGTQQRFLVRIPFEVWNLDKGIQVNYEVYDRNQSDPTVDGFKVWNTTGRMYAEILNTPYEEKIHTPSDAPWTWNNVWYNSQWTTGDVIQQFYANPLQLGKDTYTFTAPAAPSENTALAKEDVKNINVFPNPYYGVNPQEINKYQRFVTFNHLPRKATIRIFNIAGQMIRVIDKNSSDQFQRWDLLTESGLPVASGLYIVYVDMPELGTTKILKAAVIQEEQVLDRF